MALFDFLKKKEEPAGDLGPDFGPEPAFPGAGGMPPGMPGMPPMGGMPGMGGQMPGMQGMPPMGGDMFGQGPGGQRGGAQFFGEPQMQQGPPMQPMTPTTISFQPQQPQGFGPQPGFGESRSSDVLRGQIDVVLTKLDSLKASIDRLNERMEYIERYLIGRR